MKKYLTVLALFLLVIPCMSAISTASATKPKQISVPLTFSQATVTPVVQDGPNLFVIIKYDGTVNLLGFTLPFTGTETARVNMNKGGTGNFQGEIVIGSMLLGGTMTIELRGKLLLFDPISGIAKVDMSFNVISATGIFTDIEGRGTYVGLITPGVSITLDGMFHEGLIPAS